MDYQEYKEKYDRLQSEYTKLDVDEQLSKIHENPLDQHPVGNKNWIDYARDQQFTFRGLQLPRNTKETKDFYKWIHEDFEKYLLFMTIHKDFIICPTCGTRWTLDIQLDGSYIVCNAYGDTVIDTDNKDNYYMLYFKLPKYISTVKDLQQILDVIEMQRHGKEPSHDP